MYTHEYLRVKKLIPAKMIVWHFETGSASDYTKRPDRGKMRPASMSAALIVAGAFPGPTKCHSAIQPKPAVSSGETALIDAL